MKRNVSLLAVAAVLAVTSALALPGASAGADAGVTGSAAAPSCGLRWGSLPEDAGELSTASVTGIRAGRHACFDRLVFDLAGGSAGYRVAYVDAVRGSGSGAVVPVRGGARLQVTLRAPAYDQNGKPTYAPRNPRESVDVRGFATVRQVSFVDSFEGYTTVGVGVRARLPFRVFVLDGPGAGSRIVVDVAHRW